jgi:hypothetical protein
MSSFRLPAGKSTILVEVFLVFICPSTPFPRNKGMADFIRNHPTINRLNPSD